MSRINRPAVPASLGAREVMTADSLEASLRDVDFDAVMESLSGRLGAGKTNEWIAEQTRNREQIAVLAAHFAADPKYRPLFEWLLDITLRRPVSIAGMGEHALEYVNRREGANSVVWQLLQAVAEGREEQAPIRET
jgi:hypothetical protein